MLKFTDKIMLRSHDFVMRYYGQTNTGEPLFAYLLCNEGHILQINKDYESKISKNLLEYGCKVLYVDHVAKEDEKARSFLKQWVSDRQGNVI